MGRMIFGGILALYFLLVVVSYPTEPDPGEATYSVVINTHLLLCGLPGSLLFFFGLRAIRNKSTDAKSDSKDYSKIFYYESDKDDESQSERAEEEKDRIFVCPAPSCSQRIRLRTPRPKGIGKCSRCHSRFRIETDEVGNLYIYSIEDIPDDYGSFDFDISSCFRLLQVNHNASSDEIKSAYRKRMLEYHPDKVAKLGKELRALAEKKAKEINVAHDILKNKGYVN